MTTLTYAAPVSLAQPVTGDDTPALSAATGGVNNLLRIEGAVALAASLLAYRAMGGSWWLFAGLFLLPDFSMLGYLANRKLGAVLYNAVHTYLAPAALGTAGWSLGAPALFGPALVWAAHIGFDRLMGYGLKYESAFGVTHLSWRGKRGSRDALSRSLITTHPMPASRGLVQTREV